MISTILSTVKHLALVTSVVMALHATSDPATTKISGTITDAAGDALAGVNVLVKGTPLGTVADTSGKFELSTSNDNLTLLFAYNGYKSCEIVLTPTDDAITLKVVMVPTKGKHHKAQSMAVIEK